MTTYITQHRLRSLKAMIFSALIMSHCGYAIPFSVSEELLEEVQMEYGLAAEQRLREWQQIIHLAEFSNDIEKLAQVNGFVNRAHPITQDRNWRRSDERADPLAFLVNHAGDGQGFTMTKLFTLYKMGMPLSKLRIGYVTATQTQTAEHSTAEHSTAEHSTAEHSTTAQSATEKSATEKSHTVLAYFSTPDAEPLILDNIDKSIRRASLRTDLEPVYLFEAREVLFPDRIASILPREKTRHVVQWQNLLPNLKAVHY